MNDYVIRASAADGGVRAFVAAMRDTVNRAHKYHVTTPVVSAALGRTLVATSIMGLMLKEEEDVITLSIKGDGPIGGVLATGNSRGMVKGYPFEPQVDLPLKPNGKLDVSGAFGNGMLSVIKDLGMKEPYVGRTPLVSGEVAEDITYYFAKSEQTPSAMALGVLVDIDYTVKQAGGFIIQIMPGAGDEEIDRIEEKLAKIPSVTAMLDSGMTPELILNEILGDFEPEILEKHEVDYYCDCSQERVERALISLGREEFTKILEEDRQAEISCHFCDKKYNFNENDLRNLLERI